MKETIVPTKDCDLIPLVILKNYPKQSFCIIDFIYDHLLTREPASVNTDSNCLPPGPKAPALFQLMNWLVRPFEYLEECVERYGDVFTLRLFGLPPYFPAGTTFVPCIYSTHHREDLYLNSKQFQPERFLERQYTPYEFLPFGGGVRLCLGYALAMLEMKLVLATILSQYNLKLASHEPIKPLRRGGTLAPSNGVPLIVTGFRSLVSS